MHSLPFASFGAKFGNKAAVKNYLFVFRVDSTANRVIVLRFFHQTQDYLGVL